MRKRMLFIGSAALLLSGAVSAACERQPEPIVDDRPGVEEHDRAPSTEAESTS